MCIKRVVDPISFLYHCSGSLFICWPRGHFDVPISVRTNRNISLACQMQVYMVSRKREKGEEAAAKIREEYGKAVQLEVLQCDFMELK